MKKLLLMITAISVVNASSLVNAQQLKSAQVTTQLEKLEKDFDGKIGVYAIDTSNNQIIAHRANERFPVQSTLKLIAVGALLKESNRNKDLLKEKILYTNDDLISWHPVTGKYLKNGMTLEAMSEAALSYSDNPATNLIMKKFGGPQFVTDFAHSIGNKTFNIEIMKVI